MGLFACRVTVHSIGGIFLLGATGLIIAAIATPHWLTYDNTKTNLIHYSGLYEHCYYSYDSQTTTSKFKICEFNVDIRKQVAQNERRQNPTVIYGDIEKVTLGLSILAGLFTFASGICASVGWCCSNCCGICMSVGWIINNVLAVICNVTTVVYFNLKLEKDTRNLFVDMLDGGQNEYRLNKDYSFILMAAAIAPCIVGAICAGVALFTSIKAHRDPKPAHV